MKMNFLKGRRSKNIFFASIAALAIILLFVLNLVLTYFGARNSLYIDMTDEGLYTLTDNMRSECAEIDAQLEKDGKIVEIIFCADPDTLTDSTVTRLVYFMALQLDDAFDNISVKEVNTTYNPTAVSKYRPTSLTAINPSDVIISYRDPDSAEGERYTVVNASSFWLISGQKLWAYNGEYKMASLFLSVTAQNRPAVYFTTGHGETYYDTAAPESEGSMQTAVFYDLLTERGLEVKTVDLTKESAIPEDCVLLIINNPTEDFLPDPTQLDKFSYVSPLEAIDRYLVEDHGSVMVAKDYATTLSGLESLLCEWGFGFSTSLVKDTTSIVDVNGDDITFTGDYNTDTDSYGYMLYGDFADLSSAPSVVFTNTGYIECTYAWGTSITEDGAYSIDRVYEPLFFSSLDAAAYEKSPVSGLYVDLENDHKALHLAGVSTRSELDSYTAETKYSDLFCAASADFFSNDMLGNTSYANYQIVSVLVENLIRTEEFASSSLGGISINLENVGGKPLVNTTIYSDSTSILDNAFTDEEAARQPLTTDTSVAVTVILLVIALSAGIVGIAVAVRRRYL